MTTKAFIVEDEETLHVLYKMMLNLIDIDVLEFAKNGEDAIAKYKSFTEKPDLILMDHRMPIKNGIETTKYLKTIDSKSKILFTSADTSVEEEALSVGAVGFLKKPFGFEELRNAILKALNLEYQR